MEPRTGIEPAERFDGDPIFFQEVNLSCHSVRPQTCRGMIPGSRLAGLLNPGGYVVSLPPSALSVSRGISSGRLR